MINAAGVRIDLAEAGDSTTRYQTDVKSMIRDLAPGNTIRHRRINPINQYTSDGSSQDSDSTYSDPVSGIFDDPPYVSLDRLIITQ
jgi:hypothetical protein